MRRRSVFLVVALSLSAASAQAQDPSRVEELKRRGNQAMMDLRYADALEAYKAAIALTPDDAVLYYNLGRAEQAREAFPEALDALEEFSRRASPEVRARVPKLDELMGEVKTRIAIVSIRCSDELPKAAITVGDRGRVDGCGATPKILRVSVLAKGQDVEVRLESSTHRAEPVRTTLVGNGVTTPVLFTVLPKNVAGTLVVRATPAAAAIAVDGTDRGNSPIEVVVGAGAHTVDVKADKYSPKHLSVVVEAGGTKEVPVTLDPAAQPLTSKWWFWTGLGVAVAAATTVVIILVVQPERDPHKGSIAPGLVRF